MARIRSDKPEAYQSETLAQVSLAAERTFKGMATIGDDRGRLADKPAQINGELWSMRGSHSPDELEGELAELVKVDLVCRYVGCDGKRYLHLVTWDSHQKIDRPSKSRLPRCPFHQVSDDYCGKHEGDCPVREDSPEFPESSRQSREDSMQTREDSNGSGDHSMLDLGPGIVDRGSVPPTAGSPKPRAARAPRQPSGNGGDVIAAFVEGAKAAGLMRPPEDIRKRVGAQAGRMLKEHIPLQSLIDSARLMGATEYDDLAKQVRIDDARANGKGGNTADRRQQAVNDQFERALQRAQQREGSQ